MPNLRLSYSWTSNPRREDSCNTSLRFQAIRHPRLSEATGVAENLRNPRKPRLMGTPNKGSRLAMLELLEKDK
jgi:hypothetical protein